MKHCHLHNTLWDTVICKINTETLSSAQYTLKHCHLHNTHFTDWYNCCLLHSARIPTESSESNWINDIAVRFKIFTVRFAHMLVNCGIILWRVLTLLRRFGGTTAWTYIIYYKNGNLFEKTITKQCKTQNDQHVNVLLLLLLLLLVVVVVAMVEVLVVTIVVVVIVIVVVLLLLLLLLLLFLLSHSYSSW
jgi:hypothetical protein